MEDQTEAKVPATKSAHSAEATKLNHSKRHVIKPPPPHQYGNEIMSNFRFPDRPRIPLGEWWMNHIPQSKDKEHANMATIGEPKNFKKAFESSNASEGSWLWKRSTNLFLANAT